MGGKGRSCGAEPLRESAAHGGAHGEGFRGDGTRLPPGGAAAEEGGGRRGSARRAARWRRAGPWALASQRPHHPQTAAGKPAASPVGGVASSSCPQGMLRGDTRGAEAGDAPEVPASTAGEDLGPTRSRGHIHQEQRPPGSSSAATVFNVALFPLLKGKKQNQLLGMPAIS